jgi:hypothetical protein
MCLSKQFGIKKILIFAITLLFSNISFAETQKPFQAHYQVLRNAKPLGEATLTLQRKPKSTWELTTHTKGTKGLAALAGADIVERSLFSWENNKPVLIQYYFRQKVAWKNKQRSMVMSDHSQIKSQDEKKNYQLSFDTKPMDRHVVILAIADDLKENLTELRYQVADRDRIDWQTYRVVNQETIVTPAGSFEAFRVERVRQKKGRSTTSWFSPKLNYLPIRIEQREADGETITMVLRKAQQ